MVKFLVGENPLNRSAQYKKMEDVIMIKIGSIYNSNNYGNVEIISKGSKYGYYLVRFLLTGTEKEFRETQIKDGCIRDPYAKALCGVACTGNVKTKGKNKVFYSIWHDIIDRCYGPAKKKYAAYRNVKVCDEWMVFENFLNDIKEIDGYDEDRIRNGELVLDKDIKQRYSKNKIYSKDTCTWIEKHINNTIQDAQQREFIAISPDGKVYTDFNITKFAKEHNLDRRHISGVLHGRTKTTGGWKFSYKEIV